MFLVSVAFAIAAQADQSALPQALQLEQSAITRMIERGYQDAERHRSIVGVTNRFKRGIGKVEKTILRDKTVSWIWLHDTYLEAYKAGYEARHQYQSDSDYQRVKDSFSRQANDGRKTLDFYGVLNIEYQSTPKELEDVRVVLKIGGRIYQPQEQPGDLGYDRIQHRHWHDFKAPFNVRFDLFDPSGAPRVNADDRKIAIVVIYGPNEREADWTLDEIAAFHRG